MKIIVLSILLCLLSVAIKAQEANFDFNENKGQLDKSVKYHCKLHIGDIYLKNNIFSFDLFSAEELDEFHNHKHSEKEVVHTDAFSILNKHIYNMNFLNANSTIKIVASQKNNYYKNYFLGKDASKWASNVYSYQKISYQNMYDGINVNVYSKKNQLKYDFIVAKNAEPNHIKIEYEGVENLKLVNGALEIILSNGKVKELKPFSYQIINKKKQEVACEFIVEGNVLTFNFPNGYDNTKELVIDPTWEFSTLTGSNSDNWGFTATYDNNGNFYAGSIVLGNNLGGGNFGNTASFPGLVGGYQTTFGGHVDVAISKFSSNGTALLYSTYLGGSQMEEPHSLIVDAQNNIIVMGATSSTNFPVNAGSYQNTFAGGVALFNLDGINWNNGSDIFVAKLNATGTVLLGSTYLGGTENDGLSLDTDLNFNYADHARGEVILDDNNNIYIASSTNSTNFPTTNASYSQTLGGGFDGVVAKLNPTLSNLLWSTYLGGNQGDAAYSIRIDNVNNKTFVCGGTTSSDIGATAGVLNPTYAGAIDGYIAKFDNINGSLDALTYIGTNGYDQSYILEVDKSQKIYVVGQTKGTYPVTVGTYSNPGSAQFIHKLNNNLTTTDFSTVFGDGSNTTVDISITAFLVDNCNNIYVSGWGGPTGGQEGNTFGLPITAGAIQTTTDGRDFYFIVLDGGAQNLLYGTYLGSVGVGEHVDGGTSRFDKSGTIYQAVCAGCGGNSFPTTAGVYSQTNGSTNCNYGAIKIDMNFSGIIANVITPPNQIICEAPYLVNFMTGLPFPPNSYWDFGDLVGTAVDDNSPSYSYLNPGTYTVMYVAIDAATCNTADTVYFDVTLVENSLSELSIDINDNDPCKTTGFEVNLSFNGIGADSLFWDFGDGTQVSNTNPFKYRYKKPGTYTLTMSAFNFLCNTKETIEQDVTFTSFKEIGTIIPNVFTPNGDGLNDKLQFFNIDQTVEYSIQIFNRWGTKVYESSDALAHWDGGNQNEGTYFYLLNYKIACNGDEREAKGIITLLK